MDLVRLPSLCWINLLIFVARLPTVFGAAVPLASSTAVLAAQTPAAPHVPSPALFAPSPPAEEQQTNLNTALVLLGAFAIVGLLLPLMRGQRQLCCCLSC